MRSGRVGWRTASGTSLAVRKTSNGEQHTPTSPQGISVYLAKVSKSALSPEGTMKMAADAHCVRVDAVKSARQQAARHGGAPFRDNSNDQWGPPGSMGKLRGVLLKQH